MRHSMRTAALGFLLYGLTLVGVAPRGRAGGLLMFEEPGCVWCRRWRSEIGPGYPLTQEGRLAPLRRLNIREQANAGAVLERPITTTPTFVLIENGREIGRMVGYPGRDFFYGLLDELIARRSKLLRNSGLQRPAAPRAAVLRM